MFTWIFLISLKHMKHQGLRRQLRKVKMVATSLVSSSALHLKKPLNRWLLLPFSGFLFYPFSMDTPVRHTLFWIDFTSCCLHEGLHFLRNNLLDATREKGRSRDPAKCWQLHPSVFEISCFTLFPLLSLYLSHLQVACPAGTDMKCPLDESLKFSQRLHKIHLKITYIPRITGILPQLYPPYLTKVNYAVGYCFEEFKIKTIWAVALESPM